jgi:hypothetical protein
METEKATTMHTHVIDGTMLVFLGVILVVFGRVGLAAIAGSVRLLLIARCM